MHFKSLLHVRDHAKVRGTAHHLLEYIALRVNMHTGEAFELTVERLAHRLEVTRSGSAACSIASSRPGS
jgi:hypothetical protein